MGMDFLPDQVLQGTQPGIFRRELRAGDSVVARLRRPKIWSSMAVAESPDGTTWTFKLSGFFHRRITVYAADSEMKTAIMRLNWNWQGTLECANGARYRWRRTGFWCSEWIFADEMDTPLVRFKVKPTLFKWIVQVRVEPNAPRDDLMLLLMLGGYLLVAVSEAAAAAAAAS